MSRLAFPHCGAVKLKNNTSESLPQGRQFRSNERLSRLLYALVVSGLLERRENGFANTREAATFLVKGLPGYVGGNA